MLREMERHKPTADISARVIQVSESVPAKIPAYYIFTRSCQAARRWLLLPTECYMLQPL